VVFHLRFFLLVKERHTFFNVYLKTPMESQHQKVLNKKIRKAIYGILICSIFAFFGYYGLYDIYFGNKKDGLILCWIIAIFSSIFIVLASRAVFVYRKEKVNAELFFITVRLVKKCAVSNNSGGRYYYFVNKVIVNLEEYASAYRNCSFTYPKNSETEFWFKVKKKQYHAAKEGMVFKLELSKDSLTVFSIKRQKELEVMNN